MSWFTDRRHDLERWVKQRLVKKLIREAKDFWADVEPELKEILEDAKEIGEDVLASLISELRSDLTAHTREELDNLREKIREQ